MIETITKKAYFINFIVKIDSNVNDNITRTKNFKLISIFRLTVVIKCVIFKSEKILERTDIMKLDTAEKIQKKLDVTLAKIETTKQNLVDLEAEAKDLQEKLEAAKLNDMVSGLERKGLSISDFEEWLNTHADVVVEEAPKKRRGRRKKSEIEAEAAASEKVIEETETQE